MKSKGHLIQPSTDVIRIVAYKEKILREKMKREMYKKLFAQSIECKVYATVVNSVFLSLEMAAHDFRNDLLHGHQRKLILTIIKI